MARRVFVPPGFLLLLMEAFMKAILLVFLMALLISGCGVPGYDPPNYVETASSSGQVLSW